MCANYEAAKYERLLERRGQLSAPDFTYSAEIYPWRLAPFLAAQHPGIWLPGNFGLVPHWVKEPLKPRVTYNARTETVATKPTFSPAWKHFQLAIIPAMAIYEPRYEDGSNRSTRWCIERADGQPFGIAGIYERRLDDHGPTKWSFSMLTVNATDHPLMKLFHGPEDEKRSVVVLDDDEWDDWLSVKSEPEARSFLRLFDPEEFQASAAPIPRKPKKAKTIEEKVDPQLSLLSESSDQAKR